MKYEIRPDDDRAMKLADARADFADLINRAAYRGERIPLTRRGKVVAAIVPADDMAYLEYLEDEEDVREANEALAAMERGDEVPIPLDEAIRRWDL